MKLKWFRYGLVVVSFFVFGLFYGSARVAAAGESGCCIKTVCAGQSGIQKGIDRGFGICDCIWEPGSTCEFLCANCY